jgi:multidrug efflux pump subunit AcrB
MKRPDGPATLFYRNGHLLVMAVVILIAAGVSALVNLPRIEDPRIALRNPSILTFLPGGSAERVEALVTEKLENRLEELSEIKEIRSTSRTGLSFIILELQDWVDDTSNEQIFSKIRDKLNDAQLELPAGASQPDFDDKRGAVAYSLVIGVTWSRTEPPSLGLMNRLSEGLADRLRAIPGTEFVRLFGDPDEEITVTLEAGEVAALGLTAGDVSLATAGADPKQPAGVLRTGDRELIMEVSGELDSAGRVAAVPVRMGPDGRTVTLGDIATVERGWREPPREIAFSDGRRSVFVGARVDKTYRVDQWASAAREAVAQFDAGLDEGIAVEYVFDQSRYTEARLSQLGGNLLAGSVVVALVVFLGMGWRAALIVGLALPLSAGATVFGLTLFGQQIHQMSIFGMIIAIGLLIDNAIVVTDEIRQKLELGLERAAAVDASVRHLFVPLLASTLTTILGFMPIFLLPGNIGDFIGPIAISVVLALASSFLISMTVIAGIAGRYLRRPEPGQHGKWWQAGLSADRLAGRYRRALGWAVTRPWTALALGCVLPVAGFLLAGTLKNQFFPSADRDHFEVQVWMPDDASIARTAERVAAIDELIHRRDGVRKVDWVVGGSFPSVYYNAIMRQEANPAYAQGVVLADDLEAALHLIPELQEALDRAFPDAQIVVRAFGQGPPIEAPVAFRILGPGLDELRLAGDELRRIMHSVPGIRHTQASISGGKAKLWLDADEHEARQAGLTLADVAAQFQGNLEGRIGGSVLEDLEELPVRVRYSDSDRASLATVAALNLVVPASGRWVPASALGQPDLRPELATITRFNGERVNTILGYVEAGELPIEVAEIITERLNDEGFTLPTGYRLEISGDSEESRDAIGLLMVYLPVLLLIMVATLVLSFRSGVLAMLIGVVAVLSIGLGLLSLWLSGSDIGFNPILGMAGLIGVAINGSIVVIAAIRASAEARAGDPEAVVNETLGCTRHILSTTLTTMAGFLPLLLFTGGQFWPPLAVVLAGGVGFAVTLSLWFTPAAYCLISRRAEVTA